MYVSIIQAERRTSWLSLSKPDNDVIRNIDVSVNLNFYLVNK